MASTPDELDKLIGVYVKETAASAFEDKDKVKVKVKVKEALEKIESSAPKDLALPLQVLALRRYIRKVNELKVKGKDLDDVWVWSDEDCRSYKTSPKGARAIAQAKIVIKTFKNLYEKSDPGVTLEPSGPRNLDSQVKKWNGASKCQLAAKNLMQRCRLERVAFRLPHILPR